MKLSRTIPPLLVLMLAAWWPAGALHAAAAATEQRVVVRYEHPQQFTETRKTRAFTGLADTDYLDRLKVFLQRRAVRILGPDQRLDIVITDIDRAGNFEPWLGPNYDRVRIIRDVYPPRINLHFRLLGADGKVLRQGKRILRDPGFMSDTPTLAGSSDPLRYEKHLLDRWLRKGATGL